MNWQPAISRLMEVVHGDLGRQEIFSGRLNDWRQYDDLPPILVTAGGWVVDGHHRLIVARERGEQLWGQVVVRSGEHWAATGNITRVK